MTESFNERSYEWYNFKPPFLSGYWYIFQPPFTVSKKTKIVKAKAYDHNGNETLMRPEIGLQSHFKKKKEPVKYRFDKSLDPELSWDINADREHAESLIEKIRTTTSLDVAKVAAEELKRMSKPFLNWAGKAERHEMTVPTLPLFIHERLSTQAILETLKGHKRDTQMDLLFADPQLDLTDRITKAYEHKDRWVNRMILGDSLLVMNSLLQYESMAEKVQMIYIDPPYGVKFGSNFQPFIRRRDVKHNDDRDFTREPEMVQAYRDTWELGLHSYLTYMRERLLLAKELLTSSGSVFVQIGDENVHHIREIMDEVFGEGNFCSIITFRTGTSQPSNVIPSVSDYLLWYAKDRKVVEYHDVFRYRLWDEKTDTFDWVEFVDGKVRKLTSTEKNGEEPLKAGKLFKAIDITRKLKENENQKKVDFNYSSYSPPSDLQFNDRIDEMIRLNRVIAIGNKLYGKRYESDFPFVKFTNLWEDTVTSTFASNKTYVVQTNTKVILRCLLMTTDPGDIVIDPTCGSGTTAYVAEQWGRRWITIDTSRVPLALARQRLLTATYQYYEMLDEKYGIAGGFKYERKQNKKGDEVGGIVPHITLKSLAKNEMPKEEVLVDRPNVVPSIVRVSGPFTLEATIPTPIETETDKEKGTESMMSDSSDYKTRMLETLRKVATIQLKGHTVKFKGIKAPVKSLSLDAEAEQIETNLEDIKEEASIQKSLPTKPGKPVAFVFGPENGAVTDSLVRAAADEANLRHFQHLYVIGFSYQDSALKFISRCEEMIGIPASYVSATMDLQMGDLLKDQRSSQIFAVTGLPDVRLIKLKKKSDEGENQYQVELMGLDTFDPVTMETIHMKGDDVPAWFLDCDYNELAFCANQAFFPRTTAWNNLKKSLKGTYDDAVWEHLAGAKSVPFTAAQYKKIAVKVIDDRGNELMVVMDLKEAIEEK